MKTVKYMLIFLILLQFACSNDDDSSNELRIVYEQDRIENTFLQTGETAPPTVNWMDETGTFSATTLTSTEGDDLVGRAIFIDEVTGVLSWNRSLPPGEKKVFITAANSFLSTTITLTIKNTFTEGFFIGGFNNDASNEPDYSDIVYDLFLVLSENRTIDLINNTSTSIATGTWTIDENVITIEFIFLNNPEENLTMKGELYSSTGLPVAEYTGQWGQGLDQNNNIIDRMGVFIFEID